MEPASQLCHLLRDLEKSPREDDRAKGDTMLYAVWGAAFSVTSLNVAANTEMTDGQPVLP